MPTANSRSPGQTETIKVLTRISEVSARLAGRLLALANQSQPMEGGQANDERRDHRRHPRHQERHANVWEPKSINGDIPKYSVSLIIPKSDTKTVAKIKAAIEAAYAEGESKLKGSSKTVPSLAAIKTPLRDGDAERPDDPAYANAYFINANSATAPGIVDADLNPVITRSEVYSGVYGRASITLYASNSNGNRGIACGLNNLQLIRAGEPLGGKASAETDFATDDDDSFHN